MSLRVGDFVRYAGPGCSVLDAAPGIVVEATPSVDLGALGDSDAVVRVQVVKKCAPAGNQVRAGSIFVFNERRLQRLQAWGGVREGRGRGHGGGTVWGRVHIVPALTADEARQAPALCGVTPTRRGWDRVLSKAPEAAGLSCRMCMTKVQRAQRAAHKATLGLAEAA